LQKSGFAIPDEDFKMKGIIIKIRKGNILIYCLSISLFAPDTVASFYRTIFVSLKYSSSATGAVDRFIIYNLPINTAVDGAGFEIS